MCKLLLQLSQSTDIPLFIPDIIQVKRSANYSQKANPAQFLLLIKFYWNSATPICLHILSVLVFPQQLSWVGTKWPTKPKIFSTWSFTEKFANPCSSGIFSADYYRISFPTIILTLLNVSLFFSLNHSSWIIASSLTSEI